VEEVQNLKISSSLGSWLFMGKSGCRLKAQYQGTLLGNKMCFFSSMFCIILREIFL
jgi:hypothetical protein